MFWTGMRPVEVSRVLSVEEEGTKCILAFVMMAEAWDSYVKEIRPPASSQGQTRRSHSVQSTHPKSLPDQRPKPRELALLAPEAPAMQPRTAPCRGKASPDFGSGALAYCSIT